MSLVDLSGYKSTKVPEREVELIDNHTGARKMVLNAGEGLDRLLVDFLRGRINIEKIPGSVGIDEVTARQDLIDLGIEVGSL